MFTTVKRVVVAAIMAAMASGVPVASAQQAPFCNPGQQPTFQHGFAALKARLGATMGEPTECEHANSDNGDSIQHTATGLSFYRKSTNTPTFTNGFEHWGLTAGGLVSWTGEGIDPPGMAAVSSQPAPARTVPSPSSPPQPQIDAALMPVWETLINSEGHSTEGPVGPVMRRVVEVTGVRLVVGQLAPNFAGVYRLRENTVTINRSYLAEDRRALATMLAHELTHAAQAFVGQAGRRDCVQSEVEAFNLQASLWYSYWPSEWSAGKPPARTALERHLNEVTWIWGTEGEAGLYRYVVGKPNYQAQCELWMP